MPKFILPADSFLSAVVVPQQSDKSGGLAGGTSLPQYYQQSGEAADNINSTA